MSGFAPQEQRRLLDLQEVDSRTDVLDQQWRAHPAVHAIHELSERSATLEDEKAAAEQAVQDTRGRVRSAEREAEDIRARQAKDQKRLDAGSVSSPRELESLQHEIATLQTKLDDVETIELEAMEELDSVEATLAGVAASLAAVIGDRERHEQELSEARSAIDAEREALAADRAQMLDDISPELVAQYERARKQHGGVGVGALRHGRCEGCRLSLTPADLSRVHAAPEDELLRCEECGRLLVRVED
jgi:predicted  nucleic acid-binding Zn-ribbon protein